MTEEKLMEIISNRIITLQSLVDYYLKVKEGKNFAEMYPEIEDKYGVLNRKQEEILHEYLKTVYESYGVDLEKVLEEKKEEKKPGSYLTKFEMDELIRIADEHYLLIGIIVDRNKRLLKNKKESE